MRSADGRGKSLLLVEVEGMDGVARRIQLWDDSEPDWRALVCDKAGVPAQTPSCALPSAACCRSCDSIRASLFDTVLGGDLADSILMRLGPEALALLSAASMLMRARCRCDALWIRHWREEWISTRKAAAARGVKPASGGGGGGSMIIWRFDDYLESIVAGARASGQIMSVEQPRHIGKWKVGELQLVYGYRMAARRQVQTGWDMGAQFFSAASLRPGLTDPQIWELERSGSSAPLLSAARGCPSVCVD